MVLLLWTSLCLLLILLKMVSRLLSAMVLVVSVVTVVVQPFALQLCCHPAESCQHDPARNQLQAMLSNTKSC